MALKKIDYTDKRGVWSCPDCGWESDEVDFRKNPSPPYHQCKKPSKQREPTFEH